MRDASEIAADLEYLGPDSVAPLTDQQLVLFSEIWPELLTFLREQARNPERNRGYAESSIPTVARRIIQGHQYQWSHGQVTVDLSPGQADAFVHALNDDEVTTAAGEPYAEGSKRKFCEAIAAYFRYREIEWEPPIRFGSGDGALSSDPFTMEERELLMQAAFEFNSPPNYKSVSPEERDRLNAHIAQLKGVEKTEIGPSDWDRLQQDWEVPALISTALDIAPRAELISRLTTGLVNFTEEEIQIPSEIAVKNNQEWDCELSSRSVRLLEKWFEQRENTEKYDDSKRIWLNRVGNPHHSGTLNTLLRNLLAEAEITSSGRRLTWHSIRHSTGMYVYKQKEDISWVAEVLRHQSLEAARKYAHPTPESKTDLIESLQRGDI